MKTIKFVTLDSMNTLSEELSEYAKDKKLDIGKKIADFLMTKGNSKFVDLYNDFAKSKDHKSTLTNLGITNGNHTNSSNKTLQNSL
jgi:hypothetical protein